MGAEIENLLGKIESNNQQENILLSMYSQSLNYLQPIEKKLHDKPIYGWPIKVEDYDRITSVFGYRLLYNPFTGGSENSHHKGLDLVGTRHARVVAVADGVVVENYPPPNGYFKGHPLLGGMIKIKHTDGTYSVYGHLSAVYVSEYGRKRFVKKGEIIGRTGNTGKSLGEHLHFELHNKDDVSIQPLFYLKNPKQIY